jgi:transmembrane sensor
MERRKRIEVLAKKWLENKIQDDERDEFDSWYNSFDDTKVHFESEGHREETKSDIYEKILERSRIKTGVKKSKFRKPLIAAASILLFLTTGLLYLAHRPPKQKLILAIHKTTILPGGNQAILVLANGQKIALANAKNGVLRIQGAIKINKVSDGELAYTSDDKNASQVADNILETPRGGQYHLVLSDGTEVWLNAASSLKFPVSFTAGKRQVTLNGEAYFEVTKDRKHPFIVISGSQKVEVLGTHFNINSYKDEPSVQTTLLEGSVAVTNSLSGQTSILVPGQQSVAAANDLFIRNADTEEATAWKNGYFMFNDEDISSIMRKISRWYNVDIVYEGAKPVDKFEGTVNRFSSVQEVLKKLELTDRVHFKIEERRIMVSQ